jgi:hypothetical protein
MSSMSWSDKTVGMHSWADIVVKSGKNNSYQTKKSILEKRRRKIDLTTKHSPFKNTFPTER